MSRARGTRGNRARKRGSRTTGRFRALASRRFLLQTALIAAVAFGIGYLLVTLFLFGSAPDRVVTVPDLRGVGVEQARSTLERADLVFEAGSELVHPRVPAGSVLAQSPLPGQEVAPGSAVQVVVSAGRDRMPIPDVSRLGAEQAVQVLQRTGFRVLLQEVSDLRDSGQVVEIRPSAGTPVELPGRVQLVVSSGPPRVPVPDLYGLTEGEARAVLDDAGLSIGEIELEPISPERPGVVIGQNPAPEDSAAVGSAVQLTVVGLPPVEIIRPRRRPPRGASNLHRIRPQH